MRHHPDQTAPAGVRQRSCAAAGAPGAHIMDFAAQHRLPGVHAYRELVEAGGLMSYGPSYADMHRRAATYVDKILKILKGAKPADLPVQAPTKFELVINHKAAKALGIDIPTTLLARADEVIE
jgi:putative ABC transport system substrate-binding protein